jgi:hypothetical protein
MQRMKNNKIYLYQLFETENQGQCTENWKDRWKIARKGRYYAQFDQTLSFQIKEYLSADRLSFSTFTQMKLGYEYFKAYLHQLSDYDSKKCHGICVRDQTSEHLLTVCQHFKKEQTELKINSERPSTLYSKGAVYYSRRNKAVLQFQRRLRWGSESGC